MSAAASLQPREDHMTTMPIADAPNLEQDEPWTLSKTPNYAQARPLEEVDAQCLDERTFRNEYVQHNRPCVLRGAIHHWPACAKWGDQAYLKSRTVNLPMPARRQPLPEYIQAAHPSIRAHLGQLWEGAHETIGFHDFLALAHGEARQLVLGSVLLEPHSELGPLHLDLGDFKFLRSLEGSRMYPPHRAFIYRHSYTDWHYHATDETFMTQVVGTKEVLLLPPDRATWEALWPVVCQTGRLYDVDTARFPRFGAVVPLRVVVRPGDALYIPAYWWHAVASIDNQFGITVASTFSTPLHINGDLRFPATRRFIKRYWRSKRAPMIAAAVAAALVRRATGKGAAAPA
jgi:hypothetical protein